MLLKKFDTPSERFEMFVRVLRFSASICGIDLLRDNYRMNWITYTLFTSIAGYFIFVFLTIYKNFKDDWSILLKATVTLGTAFQGVSKLFSFITDKAVIVDLYKLLSDIYKNYEKMGDKYWQALDLGLEKTKKGVYSLMLLYTIGYFGTAALPYIWMLVTGEHSLVLEFEVPGLDVQTDFGYYTTLGFQTVLVVCFAFGLYCGDLLALMYLLQSFMFAHIFAAKIGYVNEMVENPENNKKPSVTIAIKDIIEWLQLYSDYTTRCNNLFYYIITVQIISAFASTVLSIYLIIAGGWPGAYTYVVIAFSSLYLYCILDPLSFLLDLFAYLFNIFKNQKFEEDIYAMNWYNLNVQQQKMVLQVLFMTHTPKIIDIAGVAPLSVSTALSITKTVYSITMFMFQFLLE